MKQWTRTRIMLVAAALLIAACVAVIVAAQAARSPKAQSDVKWLHDYAVQMSTQAMSEPHPVMQYALTTVAKARAALAGYMHLTAPSGVDLCLAILHGHFTYTKAHTRAGAPDPTGTTLVLIVDARTHDHLGLLLTSGHINTKALGHLSSL